MKILLIAPDLESKYVKAPKGFKILYPIMFSTSGLQLLAALTPEHHEVEIIDETIGEKINYNRQLRWNFVFFSDDNICVIPNTPKNFLRH